MTHEKKRREIWKNDASLEEIAKWPISSRDASFFQISRRFFNGAEIGYEPSPKKTTPKPTQKPTIDRKGLSSL